MATRKDIKKAEELRISQIGDFKKRLGGVMELPSSLVVKVRNPGGLQAFMSSGAIPNALMTLIQKGIKTGKGLGAEDLVEDGKMDPQLLADMTTLMDNIALKTIVEPKFHPVPEDEDDRSDELLYVDELPNDDKQFLFQWISGGTRDLETFRKKLDGHVDAMAKVTVAGDATEPTDGANIR